MLEAEPVAEEELRAIVAGLLPTGVVVPLPEAPTGVGVPLLVGAADS